MTLKIYGAGMAGLLAATMLRRLRPEVHEAQDALPDNHGALLRFRTNAVEAETRIQLRRVNVLKAIATEPNVSTLHGLSTTCTLREANQYSQKVTGSVLARSVLDLLPCERFIAPDQFLVLLAEYADITFESPLTKEILERREGPIISTIPMPVLMDMVGWIIPRPFPYQSIWSVTATITEPLVDTYQTIYFPHASVPYYRASLTGNRLIIEYRQFYDGQGPPDETAQEIPRLLRRSFGIEDAAFSVTPPKFQKYGKLLPLPDAIRHEFMTAMTDEYNLYSVGRFATWRQILLDDVVSDVKKVERWITQRSSYHRRLETSDL